MACGVADPVNPRNQEVGNRSGKLGSNKRPWPPKAGNTALGQSISEQRQHFGGQQQAMWRRIKAQQA